MRALGFKRENLPADIISGAVSALVAVPDAIASATLAGVNPTYAFNSLMTGTPIGALLTSSHFMSIGLTSAMMLGVADALAGYSDSEFLGAIFTLAVLIGLFMLAAGLLKLGRFTQFISNTVMVGFLTGIAVVVILGQLGDLTGSESDLSGTVPTAIDILLHPGEWNLPSVAVGLATMAMVLLLDRTRLKNFAVALGMVIGTGLVLLLGLDSVELVGDTSQISGSFPLPVLPDISLIPSLVLSAIALGLIALIQGSGVSQSIPNPDGEYPDASKDFTAQGVANVVAGTFRGLPLGGSLGGTGIIMSSGGRSRWANVSLGLFVIAFVLLLGNLVELVAMPTIAAVLIIVGIQIINREELGDIWDIGASKRWTMVATFVATLALPVQQAIFIGVLLSFIDYGYSSSKNVQLLMLHRTEAGELVERPVPQALEDESITVLHARGSSYFAAARTMQQLLPSAKGAHGAIVIIRMRGLDQIGSTYILVLERYAAELRANDGRLMLSGVSERVLDQLLRTETTEAIPEDAIHMATDTLGASTKAAIEAARMWQTASRSSVGSDEGKHTPEPGDFSNSIGSEGKED